MNILREVRKTNSKSMPIRIISILLFSVIFIVTTYAWFSSQKDVHLGGLEGEVTSWDVSYYVNEDENEILDQTATFTIDEFYPGMPVREDLVHIYNMGEASTQIYYELISVKIFGVEVLTDLIADKEIQRQGNTTNIFSNNTTYPFNISYTYDKNYLKDKYEDDITTPQSYATFKFNVSWTYEEGTTAEELSTKDLLDTQFGKGAYEYYQNSANDPSKAMEIQVRITSKMIHPSLESDIELQDSDVTISTHGKDGEGIALLELNEEYEFLGNYIEYIVLDSSETFSEGLTWQQGNKITNLSNSDTLYIRITDGTKYAEGIITINLDGLFEVFSENAVTELTAYTDSNGKKAYVPKGFKIAESSTINTIDNGFVIEDESGNQFVWVPVKDVVYNETTTIPTTESEASTDTTFYRPMARYQSGSTRYYEGMFYEFTNSKSYAKLSYRIGTANYSEPRLVLTSNNYTWDIEDLKITSNYSRDAYYATRTIGFSSVEEYGKYMNEEYTNMINSVKTYGGFYVGRYETNISANVAQSKPNLTATANNQYSTYYKLLDSNRTTTNPYYGNSTVVSSMMWNSQWNAMLNWALIGSDSSKINDQSIGNTSSTVVAKSGETLTDRINNIYDLTGNLAELVQAGNSSWTRAYRGSAITITGNYLYKTNGAGTIYYTDVGSAYNWIGSRLAIYIKQQGDTTPPTISFRDVQNGTNYIKVKVSAEDDKSGIKNYIYSISSDGGSTYTNYTGYGNTYTFENLSQNTSYKIKVKVCDYCGNTREIEYTDTVMTGILEVVEGDITLDSLYGKNGEGIAYLEIDSELADEKYSIQYQKIASGGTFSESGTWTNSQQIDNISIGDTIYARVTDGINTDNSTLYTLNVSELETYSEQYTTLTQYTDANGEKAYIPSGFKVGTSSLNSTIENGLVIENSTTGDQFVWVPVKHAIYDSADGTIPTNATEANKNKDSNGNVVSYKPMAKYQNGYSATGGIKYFEGITYTSWGSSFVKGSYAQRSASNYALGNSSYREPSLVTNNTSQYTWRYTVGTEYDGSSTYYSTALGFSSASEFGEYINSEYTNMILSVEKYGGFYVGRYETSLTGTTVKSQYNTTPMASVNWYKMYYNQDSKRNSNNPYYGNTEIVSSMIWGSQYDAVLNWILDENVYAKKVYTVTGNHTGTRRATGKTGNDFANNVIDLCSNVAEWTQEADDSSYRASRGGIYGAGNSVSASKRYYYVPTSTNYTIGSRLTLYIK